MVCPNVGTCKHTVSKIEFDNLCARHYTDFKYGDLQAQCNLHQSYAKLPTQWYLVKDIEVTKK